MSAKRGGKKKFGHKGGSRHFSNETEILAQQGELERLRQRQADGLDDVDEAGEGASAEGAVKPKTGDSSDSDSDDEEKPKKGHQTLIDIDNPNYVKPKMKKISELDKEDNDVELSRKEKEVIEKERARAEYQRLHAEGKTDEARADLARLAIIRKQREDAAKAREDIKKAKDATDMEKRARDEARKKELEDKVQKKKTSKKK